MTNTPTSDPSVAPAPQARKILVWAALSLLTLIGFLVRAERLVGVEGKLGEDESRLVLAAQGVLATGLPTVPSGKVYWRGAVNSYLTAASLWLFGRSDFAARLPNTVVGALFIPLLFFFGRALGGTTAGLCLAVFAAAQPDLIRWSANAWMTSLFIVVFIAAAYLLYLGYERDRSPMQLAGAAAVVLAVLAHELGALLAVAVLLTLAVRTARGDHGWFSGRGSAAALGILGLSLLLFVALGLSLRTGTVSGSAGEFKHYLVPSVSLDRFLLDYKRWQDGYLPLVAAAMLGIPLLLRSLKSGGLFLYAAMAVTSLTVWVIIGKRSERYGLVLLPLLALVATWAIAEGARLAGGWQRIGARAARALRAAVFVLVFGISLHRDLLALGQGPAPPTETWLTEFEALGAAPGDLVLSDNPEIPAWYLGRVDYWDRGGNYERYSTISGNQIRHLYTGAVRVGGLEDFLRLVEANQGKILWYVGKEPALKILPPYVRFRLFRSAPPAHRTPDEVVVLRIDLSALDWIRPKEE